MERKTIVKILQTAIWRDSIRENLDMATKENLKIESESLLIVTENNAIRTNYTKAKIDNMQLNSKCKLCGEKAETFNQI